MYLAKMVKKDEDLGLLLLLFASDSEAFGDHSLKSGP